MKSEKKLVASEV